MSTKQIESKEHLFQAQGNVQSTMDVTDEDTRNEIVYLPQQTRGKLRCQMKREANIESDHTLMMARI